MSNPTLEKRDFFELKLETIASRDELRPALNCVYIKDGYVYVTDAHVAVKQSLKEIHGFSEDVIKALDGKLIHKDAIKLMRGNKAYEVTEDGVTAIAGGRKTTYHFVDERYPDVDAVFPSEKDRDEKPDVKITQSLLEKLSKVLAGNDDGVILEFYTGYKPIVVYTQMFSKNNQIALIMPRTKS